jgi:hypothetical protein
MEQITKTELNYSNYLLLWCSPGAGVLDIWLPVIKELKKRNVKIDFVFPEPSSLHLESKNSDLIHLSELFVDNVIFRGFSGHLYVEPTLLEAQSKIKFNKLYEKTQQISIRLTKGRASKFFILKKIGECFSILLRILIFIEERFSSLVLYDTSLFDSVEAVMYDVVKEGKAANKELRDELKNVHKHSMLHGLMVPWVLDEFKCKDNIQTRSDVSVYCMSKNEIEYYQKCYGVLKKNIIPIGIPRHDKDWIELVSREKNSIEGKLPDKYVFIIGRPASPYNTAERKLKALNDINDTVCKQYKLKVVIKTHPKESTDEGIYMKAFGSENYGKTWIYSDKHPILLGTKAIFCISFYSGVIIDMLAINKPTIEYLNLEGLNQYDNSNSLRDSNSKAVFQYRYTNLVLGASDKSEFDTHVSSIMNNITNVIKPMTSKYNEYFPKFDDSSKRIAENIFNKIK